MMKKLFISLTIFSVFFAAGWSLDKIITSNTHHVTEKAITIKKALHRAFFIEYLFAVA